MTTWTVLRADAPALAERLAALFAAPHGAVLATLRADGSPRVSAGYVHIG
jgi:hypothetical protein